MHLIPDTDASSHAGLVVATHPNSAVKLLNLRRLLACLPALTKIVSVSRGFEDVVRREVAGLGDASLGTHVSVVSAPNDRYDTGKWCVALDALFARPWARRLLKWVILANDSVYLVRAVPELLAALASGKYDVSAVVASETGLVGEANATRGYHVMSFLRAFTREALPAWQRYSCRPSANHSSYASKRAIINYHEVGSSSFYARERLYAGAAAYKPVLGYPLGLPRDWAEARGFVRSRGAWDPERYAVGKEGALAWWCPFAYWAGTQLSAWFGESPRTPLAERSSLLERCLERRFGTCAGQGPVTVEAARNVGRSPYSPYS